MHQGHLNASCSPASLTCTNWIFMSMYVFIVNFESCLVFHLQCVPLGTEWCCHNVCLPYNRSVPILPCFQALESDCWGQYGGGPQHFGLFFISFLLPTGHVQQSWIVCWCIVSFFSFFCSILLESSPACRDMRGVGIFVGTFFSCVVVKDVSFVCGLFYFSFYW